MVHRLREGGKRKSIVLEVSFSRERGGVQPGGLGQPKVVLDYSIEQILGPKNFSLSVSGPNVFFFEKCWGLGSLGPEVLDKDLLGLEISLGQGQRYIFLKWYRFFPRGVPAYVTNILFIQPTLYLKIFELKPRPP